MLKANAANDYNKGSYSEALEKYELLLGRYPKDGAFNYYAGLCLYHLNKELPRAAGMLEFAASRPDVPADAWYYLGRIYMKMYRFKEAGSGFDKFRETASRQDIKAFDAEQWSGHAANALEFTGSYNAYDLKASSSFSFSDTSYLVQIFSTGGRLVKKPGDLVTPGEEDESYTRYMFIPRVLNNGDYVYFSGYSKGKKGGADLFRAKYINAKRWGNIELINSLNTPHDELFPYFDPVGNDLYFATRGYSSMGGLDVFKSHYDTERNAWSEPRNLGFPLNSPFNDLLVLPGPDLGTLILVSGRMGDDKIYSVHSLHLREPKKILASEDEKELKRIANFGAVEIPEYADISKSFKMESSTTTSQMDTIASPSVLPEKNELPVSYNKNLKEALDLYFEDESENSKYHQIQEALLGEFYINT